MAQYEDIQIDRGSDATIRLELVDINGDPKDLTSHTASGKVKRTYESDSDSTWDFTTNIASPGTSGILNLTLLNSQTEQMAPGRYVYDAEISYIDSDANTIIERIIEGTLTVTPSVTR